MLPSAWGSNSLTAWRGWDRGFLLRETNKAVYVAAGPPFPAQVTAASILGGKPWRPSQLVLNGGACLADGLSKTPVSDTAESGTGLTEALDKVVHRVWLKLWDVECLRPIGQLAA